jgi:hypothetical protein
MQPNGPRKAAVIFVFATALMDVISLGIMIPVLPNLVKQFAGGIRRSPPSIPSPSR